MANRTTSLITYATDGSVNTAVTPTVTVSYAGAVASSLTPTANGSYWNVTIDDTQDATILVSGEGLVSDHLVFPRIPTDQLAEPSDIPTADITAIKAKTDSLPTDPADQSEVAALIDALPTAAEIWANATRSLTDKAGFSGTATNFVAAPSAATIASAVRTNLATELAEVSATADLATLLVKHAQNKMTKVDNNNGTMTVTIFDDNGTTPLLTYLYHASTDTRDKAV